MSLEPKSKVEEVNTVLPFTQCKSPAAFLRQKPFFSRVGVGQNIMRKKHLFVMLNCSI